MHQSRARQTRRLASLAAGAARLGFRSTLLAAPFLNPVAFCTTQAEGEIQVLSSAPDQVTGSDVIVAVDRPEGHLATLFQANGKMVASTSRGQDDGLVYHVDGLALGDNTLDS